MKKCIGIIIIISIVTGILLTNLLTNVFCDTGYNLYSPPKTDDIFTNPYKGWAPNARYGPYIQEHSLVYGYFFWNELEPEEGKYDFERLEKILKFDYWSDRGIKIILRFVMDYPSKDGDMDIPIWLYKMTNKDGTWYKEDYIEGYSPNYSNKIIIEKHDKLIKALADRYDNDKRIAFIALGSVGHWGEWHVRASVPFPKQDITNLYIKPYVEYFEKKKLLIRRSCQMARDNNIGLYNDSFGDYNNTIYWHYDYYTKGYVFWHTKEYHSPMPDFWKTAPSGGEFPSRNRNLKFMQDNRFEETLRQLRLTHISWLGPSCSADVKLDETMMERFSLLVKTMGYRFQIESANIEKKVMRNNHLNIKLNINNLGIAPFYYDWPFELSIYDTDNILQYKKNIDVDIKSILPGNHILDLRHHIPLFIGTGNYNLCISINDPITGKPSVYMANEEFYNTKRYKIGSFEVIENPLFSDASNIDLSLIANFNKSYWIDYKFTELVYRNVILWNNSEETLSPYDNIGYMEFISYLEKLCIVDRKSLNEYFFRILTRGDIMEILYITLLNIDYTDFVYRNTDKNHFIDSSSDLSDFQRKSLDFSLENGLILGRFKDNNYYIDYFNEASRLEALVILYRCCLLLNNGYIHY